MDSAGKDKTLIMYIPWGGLGDHLFWSHLPRIAKQAGYKQVFLSRHSELRHPDYARLIWEANPFFDGLCDEKVPYPEFSKVDDGLNLLDQMMFFVGLDDGKRFHEPEIFYKPRFRADVAGKTIFDPNFVSGIGNCSSAGIRRYFKKEKIKVDFQLKPRAKSLSIGPKVNQIETRDVFDYCDIIASCGRFICLTSGGATLAAALGKPATALYGEGQLPMFHHSKLHTYVMTQEPPYDGIGYRIKEYVKRPFRRVKRILQSHGG